MSATIVADRGKIIFTGNPCNVTVRTDLKFSSITRKGVSKVNFPSPATYAPYTDEDDPAFTLTVGETVYTYYTKTNPASSIYHLGLQENYETFALYMAHVLSKFKANTGLFLIFNMYLDNNNNIVMQSRYDGTEYAPDIAELRLIDVNLADTSAYSDLVESNVNHKLGLALLKNLDSPIEIEKFPLPYDTGDLYDNLAQAIFNISPFLKDDTFKYFVVPGSGYSSAKTPDTLAIMPFDKYGTTPEKHYVLPTEGYYLYHAGLSEEKYAELLSLGIDLDDYFAGPVFLTSQPTNKRVTRYSPEMLYFIASQIHGTYKYQANATITDSDGVETEVTLCTVASHVQYDILAIDVSYTSIKAKITGDPVSWKITVNFYSAFSAEYTYTLDQRVLTSERHLIMLNKMGGYDTICLTGKAEYSADIKKEYIDLEVSNDLSAFRHLETTREGQIIINSGHLTNEEARWLVELLESPDAYYYLTEANGGLTAQTCIPLRISDHKIKYNKDGNFIENIEIVIDKALISGLVPPGIFVTPDPVPESTWSLINAPFTNVNDVFFITPTTGWICGNSGNIYKTTDGGETWSACISNTSAILNSIYFTSETTGYCTSSASVLKTTDGGATWSALNLSALPNYLKIYFYDNVGYILKYTMSAGTSKTTDAGENWTVGSWFSYNTHDIAVINATTCFVVADAGVILKTTNSGSSWDIVDSGTTANLNSIFFIDSTTGYIVGAGGVFLKTINGGTTWEIVNCGYTDNFVDVYAVAEKILILAQKYVLSSTDDGITWTKETEISGDDLLISLFFTDELHGYVVGTNKILTYK